MNTQNTNPGYRCAKWLLRALARRLFRITVQGDATQLANPRTLIVANHESFLDGLLLGLFLPVDAVFVVHREILRNPLIWLCLRFIPHLAVESNSPLAIKLVCRLVESGRPVVIFPEGRITVTGALMKVYDGAAFVAARTGAAVVPVRIAGAGQSYFSRLAGVYPRRLLPRIRMTILPRTAIPMPALPSAKLRRRRAGELMRRILVEMLVATRPQRTLFEAFLDARDTFGGRYRLVEDVRLQPESYDSLLKMALAMQRLLTPRTASGEIVGVLMPNAAPTLSLLLGLSAAKRVPAMLNYTAGALGVQAACTAAGIRTVVASRAFIEKARLQPLLAALQGVEVIWLEDLKARLSALDRLWILARLLRPRRAVVTQSPEDAAIVLFTSGSEGSPKGVVHSHASLLANIAQMRAVADFSPLDRFMVALPLFHSFGLACGAIMPLAAGCRVFLRSEGAHV